MSARESVVSRFIFLHRFVVDMLDLDLYRCNLDPTAFPLLSDKSNDSVGPFWIISGWLHYAGAFLVSRFVFLRWIDLYRSEFDAAALTAASNVSVRTFRSVCGWLRKSGTFQVSRFVLLRHFDLHRFNLESSASMVMPNGSEWTICEVDGWHGRHRYVSVSRSSYLTHMLTISS